MKNIVYIVLFLMLLGYFLGKKYFTNNAESSVQDLVIERIDNITKLNVLEVVLAADREDRPDWAHEKFLYITFDPVKKSEVGGIKVFDYACIYITTQAWGVYDISKIGETPHQLCLSSDAAQKIKEELSGLEGKKLTNVAVYDDHLEFDFGDRRIVVVLPEKEDQIVCSIDTPIETFMLTKNEIIVTPRED